MTLPGRLHSEKDATYTNKAGRVQRVNTAIRAFHKTRSDWMILCGLMELLDVDNKADSVEAVFQELSEIEKAFQGLQWESIGSDGINAAQFDEDPGRNEVSELSKTA